MLTLRPPFSHIFFYILTALLLGAYNEFLKLFHTVNERCSRFCGSITFFQKHKRDPSSYRDVLFACPSMFPRARHDAGRHTAPFLKISGGMGESYQNRHNFVLRIYNRTGIHILYIADLKFASFCGIDLYVHAARFHPFIAYDNKILMISVYHEIIFVSDKLY